MAQQKKPILAASRRRKRWYIKQRLENAGTYTDVNHKTWLYLHDLEPGTVAVIGANETAYYDSIREAFEGEGL